MNCLLRLGDVCNGPRTRHRCEATFEATGIGGGHVCVAAAPEGMGAAMTVPGGAGSQTSGSREGVEVENDELLGIGEAHESTGEGPKVGPGTQQDVRSVSGKEGSGE